MQGRLRNGFKKGGGEREEYTKNNERNGRGGGEDRGDCFRGIV